MKKSLLISAVLVVVMAFGFAHAQSKGSAAKNRAVSKSSPKASSYNTVWKPVDNTRPLPKTPNTEYQKAKADFKQKLNSPEAKRQTEEMRRQVLNKIHNTPEFKPLEIGPGSKLPDFAPNVTKVIDAIRNATRHGR